MSEVYVFLGPTLSQSDARDELDAVYLPPVSEGDICRLWRRRPRIIGIVDGYFERVPAVWHKEIMWIMERGVHVFGSAGMGALRAAELDTFGMRGVGWVYKAFRSGRLERDDEVAVSHGTAEDGYRALSEAMVNIRRTLEAACRPDIISKATSDLLTVTGTALFYQDRNWPALLTAARAAGANPAELSALRRWLPAGRVDQQSDDAVAMLREMRSLLASNPAPQQVGWTMANTSRWETAKRRAGTTADKDAADPAPVSEAIVDEIRLLGPGALETARCRSLVRLFAADFAEREGMMIGEERRQDVIAEFRIRSGLEQGGSLARFLEDNELSARDFERLIVADEMVRWTCEQAGWNALDGLLDDLRIHGNYARLATKAEAKLDTHKARSHMAPEDAAHFEQAAIRWFFTERHGSTVPEDLANYAQSSGFADEHAFRQAVRREYQYVCG